MEDVKIAFLAEAFDKWVGGTEEFLKVRTVYMSTFPVFQLSSASGSLWYKWHHIFSRNSKLFVSGVEPTTLKRNKMDCKNFELINMFFGSETLCLWSFRDIKGGRKFVIFTWFLAKSPETKFRTIWYLEFFIFKFTPSRIEKSRPQNIAKNTKLSEE